MSASDGRLIRVALPDAVFGVIVHQGTVTYAAPIAKRRGVRPGAPERASAARLRAAGASFREVTP